MKTLKIFGSSKWPVRIGYMGAGLILAAHWTLEPLFFIAGFSCVLVQVSYRRQWNLVALNTNGLIAWICLLYTSPSPRDVEESRMPSSA